MQWNFGKTANIRLNLHEKNQFHSQRFVFSIRFRFEFLFKYWIWLSNWSKTKKIIIKFSLNYSITVPIRTIECDNVRVIGTQHQEDTFRLDHRLDFALCVRYTCCMCALQNVRERIVCEKKTTQIQMGKKATANWPIKHIFKLKTARARSLSLRLAGCSNAENPTLNVKVPYTCTISSTTERTYTQFPI